MGTKADELKKLTADKKELAAKQKALREELNATKEERNVVRTMQAEARKQVREHKAALRDQTSGIYTAFSEGDSQVIGKLADDIMETSTALAGAVRAFAESSAELEEL